MSFILHANDDELIIKFINYPIFIILLSKNQTNKKSSRIFSQFRRTGFEINPSIPTSWQCLHVF